MAQSLTLGNLIPTLLGSSANSVAFRNSTFVGIDFGTSTTVVSIAALDPKTNLPVTRVLGIQQKLPDGTLTSSEKIPTVIACYEKKILVGQGAADLKFQLKKGRDVWYSFKMELGEDLGDKYYESTLGHGNPSGKVLTKPKDAARIFFEYMKKEILKELRKAGLSENIQYAVSIPASFEANQRRELVEALEANGMQLNRQSLIDEPNAAFLSYVKQSEADGNPLVIPDAYNANVLVFDFGAGTCDVSILEIGQGVKGLYSRNLAISEFKKLGGDDIDRYIATTYLLPQLLEANQLKADAFRSRELTEGVIPALLKSAEQLKIGISNLVGMRMSQRQLPELATSEQDFKLGVTVRIDTKKGVLELHEPKLSYQQFAEVMSVFLKIQNTGSGSKHSIQDDSPFISVFNPIQSALGKAGSQKGDIDYVLFIGGSAQNPYVQAALRAYFPDSELLIPQDLQTHVSLGASLHSLLYNGLNTNVIQPITSEPIILITKDEQPRVLIPAGELVPTQPITIEDLVTDRQQDAIELPICVGSVNKMLFNVRISTVGGFAAGTVVRLSLELNSDKLLHIQASAADKTVMAEPMSPFANRDLTTEERVIVRAERQVNLLAAQNGGKPTKKELLALSNAYDAANKKLQAAETLEYLIELYDDWSYSNNAGNHYFSAGRNDKAIEFYERALDLNPTDSVIQFNLALSLRDSDPNRYAQLLEKSHAQNPDDPVTLFELGRLRRKQENPVYTDLYQKAFDSFNECNENGQMRDWYYSWFASLADEMGKSSLAQTLRLDGNKDKNELFYESENLTRTLLNDNLLAE